MEINAKKDFSRIGLLLFIGSLIVLAVQYVSSFVAGKIPAIAQDPDLSVLAVMIPMYLIAMPIIFLMFKKVPVTITGEKKAMKPHHILAAFCIAYAATYACNFIGTMITSYIAQLKGSQVDNVVMNLTSAINPLTTLFLTVICAPVMEELMFRKMLIDRTYKYGEGMSIVFSGLVFGLFHGNLNQFAYAFVLGIFFGFIYVKTKNIIYTIILHMIINFVGGLVSSFILEESRIMEFLSEFSYLQSNHSRINQNAMMDLMNEYASGIVLFLVYALCLFAVVIAGTIIFLVNRKKFVLEPAEVAVEKGKGFVTMVLNVGMILYCIYWIINIVIQLVA